MESARLPDKTRLAPIFFDRAELAAGPDLSAQVRKALAQSAALLVVASPAARASRWVGQLTSAIPPGRYGFAWGALAAGADIVIAEHLLASDAELHVVLPCPVEQFEAQSVAPAGP